MAFRILSLDGGGPWSLIQIMTLMDLYRSGGSLLTGHQVLRDFDLVVASSGGSLILGGLIKDLPLADIQRYVEDAETRRAVFPKLARRPFSRLLDRVVGIGPRYSSRRKLEGLRRILNTGPGEPGIGDLTLDSLKTRTRLATQIMIAAFDYDRQRQIFFRSNVQSRAADFATPAVATLAEAIHASTTVPLTFFDAPAAVSRSRRCWGGAVGGAANPVLAGVAEALANGVEPQAIQVLSIGAGSLALPLAGGNEDAETAKLVQRREAPGRARDLRKLTQVLLDDPSDNASFLAHLALGQAVPKEVDRPVADGSVVRMNPLIQPVRVANGWVRPAGLTEGRGEADEFTRLRHLPLDALAEDDVALIKKFCRLWHNGAIVNQPIRANADDFSCEIGQRWYTDAKSHWLALTQQRNAGSPPVAAAQAGPGPANGPTIATTASAPARSLPPARLGSKSV